MTFVILWRLSLITFVSLWYFVSYDICRIMSVMTFVEIMMFVAYDIFECVTYKVCRSAVVIQHP